MYWSRLGRNFYVTNTYLPSSYTRLEMDILLRTRSVATDLVTSLQIQPNRCAFMLRQFRRTQYVYVATRFILLSSTAESSATSGYVAVRGNIFSKLRNQPVLTRNGLKKAYFPSKSEFNRCNSILKHVIMIFYEYFSVFYLTLVHFSKFSSYGKSSWSLVYVIIYSVGQGISTLISISHWSDPYIFCRKME